MKNWRGWLVGLLIVAALIGVGMHVGQLDNYVRLVRQAQPPWLLAAVAFQLSTYPCLALGWHAVLCEGDGHPFGLKPLLRIALGKLFADQALPTAGMSGNVILVDQLVGIGASRGTAMAVLLISMRGYYASYLVFALASLLLLWWLGAASPLMVGLVTALVFVAIAIPAFALWLRKRGNRPLPEAIERIRPISQLLETVAEAPHRLIADRRLLLRVTLFNGLVYAADVLTLYACTRSLGVELTLSVALIAFTLASIVVTLGPIPFGLGSFEATSTGVLHVLGIPLEAALSATMLLRLLILWLPLIPGLLQLRRIAKKPSRG